MLLHLFLRSSLAQEAPLVPLDPEHTWVLECEQSHSPQQLVAAVQHLDPTLHALAGGPFVEVIGPLSLAPELRALPGVALLREPWPVSTKDTQSEGLAMVSTPQDWSTQGLSGQGVTVAVVDLGFAGLDDLLGEELPEQVPVWDEGVGAGTSHGTAVCEIIHDIAPQAELRVYPFRTEASFIAALQAAEADGADIINGSIGFDNVWHADGSSPPSLAVEQVSDAGVLYVAAAGNEVGRYISGTLSDSDGDGWLEIDGEERTPVNNVAGDISVSLRWSEPFGQAASDLSVVIFDQDGECGRSQLPQRGEDDPYESAECGESGPLEAAIQIAPGDPIPRAAWLYAPYGVLGPPTQAGTLTLPADAPSALAVGAVMSSTGLAPSYSSQGPTDDGRDKPNLAAPSQVTTATYGPLDFSGTSAAAPHATGVAALLADHARRARPETLRETLEQQALDLGEPGVDPLYGHGLIQMGALPSKCGCGSTEGGSIWAWLSVGLLLLLRRAPLRGRP